MRRMIRDSSQKQKCLLTYDLLIACLGGQQAARLSWPIRNKLENQYAACLSVELGSIFWRVDEGGDVGGAAGLAVGLRPHRLLAQTPPDYYSSIEMLLATTFGYNPNSPNSVNSKYRADFANFMTSGAVLNAAAIGASANLSPAAQAFFPAIAVLQPVLPLIAKYIKNGALTQSEAASIQSAYAALATSGNLYFETLTQLGLQYQSAANAGALYSKLQSSLLMLLHQTPALQLQYGVYPYPVLGPTIGPLSSSAINAMYPNIQFQNIFQNSVLGVNNPNIFGAFGDSNYQVGYLQQLPPIIIGLMFAGDAVFINASSGAAAPNASVTCKNGNFHVADPGQVAWDVAGLAAGVGTAAMAAAFVAVAGVSAGIGAAVLAMAMISGTITLGSSLYKLQNDVSAASNIDCDNDGDPADPYERQECPTTNSVGPRQIHNHRPRDNYLLYKDLKE